MRIAITFIDSGGQSGRQGFADSVYKFVKPRQHGGYGMGVYACKGAEKLNGKVRTESRLKNGILLQMVGTDECKSMFYSRLDIEDPGPRYIHWIKNEEFDQEYYEQCVAEEVQIHKVRGFIVRKWVKVRPRNEALDLWAYFYAALDKLNPNWSALKAKYAVPDKPRPEPKQDDTKAITTNIQPKHEVRKPNQRYRRKRKHRLSRL